MPVRGRENLKKRLGALASPNMVRRVGQGLFAAADLIKVEAQLSLTRGGSVSGAGHVPSLPGQPPNQDTGGLGGNIEAVMKAPLVAEVSSNAEYSRPLEFGTSKMAARPFMRPARDKKEAEVRDLVRRAVTKAIDEAV